MAKRNTAMAGAALAAVPTRRGWSRHSSRTFYLFISPWLVLGFIGLTVVPMVYAFLLSFTNYDGVSPHWHWVLLRNYGELLTDPDTWYSLWRTVLYAVITVPLGVAGGLGLALLLNRGIRGVGIYRTIFYVPAVVPVVATAIMWKMMFDRDAGVINALIGLFGRSPITWLMDPTAFAALVIMVLWGLGGGMVIFLAGLQGIPGELREAAAVDGANAVQTFFAVILPLLTPVLFFQVITGVIAALQTLVQPLLLTPSAGGLSGYTEVPRSNYLYMVNVYAQFFSNQRFGYGAALLWVLFALLLVITLLVFRSSTLWVFYEVEQGKGG